jgi:hypothetical protein
MILEAGRTYKDSQGRLVTIRLNTASNKDDYMYCSKSRSPYRTYTEKGEYYVSGTFSPFSLVEEVNKESKFNTINELYFWLAEGNEIVNVWTEEIYTLNNMTIPIRAESLYLWEKLIRPKAWYNSIPKQGVLCRVSSKDTSLTSLYSYDIITEANLDGFSGYNSHWSYAEPVASLNELKQYILEVTERLKF